MKKILIFAGTTEGRNLSERLSAAGIVHTVCVATEYGEIVLKEHPMAKVHCGRMNREEMREYIANGGFDVVVDATHPYAEAVTENIKEAVKDLDVSYLRLKRETDDTSDYEKITYFASNEECAEALETVEGNILLTTGSKELPIYSSRIKEKERLYVRVLPALENLMLCREQGITGKRILALQGPFTAEMNEAMIRQYQIKCLVTKRSGRTGGYREKLEAARKQDIPVFVIDRKGKQEGDSFREVCRKLETICGRKMRQDIGPEIILAGVGMGGRDCLTKEVSDAIEDADIILGAERMIAAYQPRIEKKPIYTAGQIIPYLERLQEDRVLQGGGKVVVLFSGDSGFYSGCQNLYQALQEERYAGRLEAAVRIMPGISSVAYLAACIGESYQDAAICSIHGKQLVNLPGKIRRNQKTFLLLSGIQDVNRLGKLLMDAGLLDCEIVVGYQLSYPEQTVRILTPEECLALTEEGLYCCCIKNPKAIPTEVTHGKADAEFIRDKVPMTKEEVREVSICKLRLQRGAVVYDIGSGTGSITMEIAGLSDDIQVFAIEKRKEAVKLIRQNREKFQLENIEIVEADAPERLSKLPKPTHAFIGGSGGRLQEILSILYQRNPQMRVVINAVSMETVCEMKEILSLFPMEKEEIVQVQVSRIRTAGDYHLMQAENPVWICAFTFCE